MMILRLALPFSLNFHSQDSCGVPPLLLLLSKTTSSMATPSFYKANTIVVLRNHLSTYVQKHVVRLCIRGEIQLWRRDKEY
jgi:hypothetical protein